MDKGKIEFCIYDKGNYYIINITVLLKINYSHIKSLVKHKIDIYVIFAFTIILCIISKNYQNLHFNNIFTNK